MENVFESLTTYGSWSVEMRRPFNATEIAMMASAKCVPSEYGKSIVFFMKNGGQKYISLSTVNGLDVPVNTPVDMSKCELLRLTREGSNPCLKVEVKA